VSETRETGLGSMTFEHKKERKSDDERPKTTMAAYYLFRHPCLACPLLPT